MSIKTSFIIFYSFQSDKPKASKIIRKALNDAVKHFATLGITIQIAVGAQGHSGMADIPDAIERNIESCDIFVADLTPTNFTDAKANPNANVMMELGQAKSYIGLSRMIGIAVKDDGDEWTIKDLPFDFSKNRIICSPADTKLSLISHIESCIEYINYPALRKVADVKESRETKSDDSSPVDSRIFFAQRMSQAFPGQRGLKTITDQHEIQRSLDILLASPIYFNRKDGQGGETDPIWLFRGGESMYLRKYQPLGCGRYLLDIYEFNIRSITAFRSSGAPYLEYVLIDAQGDSHTGLYTHSEETIAQVMSGNDPYCNYITEEYGLFNDKSGIERMINRDEYDDGATIIDGESYTDIDADLRVRFITPVNYLLTSKSSAYNCNAFDRTSGQFMDALLHGKITTDDFHAYLMKFPKPQY